MENIVIIGGGGHAKIVVDILRKKNFYNIIGYTDKKNRGQILDTVFLGKDEVLDEIIKQYPNCNAALGIGMISMGEFRQNIFKRILSKGFVFPPIVSLDAVVSSSARIGGGSVICGGVIINTGVIVGEGVIVNTNSSVDHDCIIGDFSHIAPGVTICGGIQIGTNCLVGSGSTIIPNVSISDHTTVGAGAVITKSFSKGNCKLFGIPAKIVNC